MMGSPRTPAIALAHRRVSVLGDRGCMMKGNAAPHYQRGAFHHTTVCCSNAHRGARDGSRANDNNLVDALRLLGRKPRRFYGWQDNTCTMCIGGNI